MAVGEQASPWTATLAYSAPARNRPRSGALIGK